MGRFLLKRLLLLAVMLFGLTIITFSISHVAPGDPAGLAAGPDATHEMVETIRKEFGLDQPLHRQFWIYLKSMFAGDFGRSLRTARSVSADLLRYFPATFELVTVSILIAILIGIPLGVLSAVHKDRWIDHSARILSVSGVALPMFWLGLMLQLLIALELGWLPLGGRLAIMTEPPAPITHLLLIDSLLRGQWSTFSDAAAHIVLPAVALCFPALASIIRVNRAEMLETLNEDYIINARAQGITAARIIGLYALKNAMIPTLTMIGLRYGWMLGGTILVETVFDWPGIGLYAVQSAIASDFQPVMGVTLLIGVNFMVANFLVDLAYGWLDPRIRKEG